MMHIRYIAYNRQCKVSHIYVTCTQTGNFLLRELPVVCHQVLKLCVNRNLEETTQHTNVLLLSDSDDLWKVYLTRRQRSYAATR